MLCVLILVTNLVMQRLAVTHLSANIGLVVSLIVLFMYNPVYNQMSFVVGHLLTFLSTLCEKGGALLSANCSCFRAVMQQNGPRIFNMADVMISIPQRMNDSFQLPVASRKEPTIYPK